MEYNLVNIQYIVMPFFIVISMMILFYMLHYNNDLRSENNTANSLYFVHAVFSTIAFLMLLFLATKYIYYDFYGYEKVLIYLLFTLTTLVMFKAIIVVFKSKNRHTRILAQQKKTTTLNNLQNITNIKKNKAILTLDDKKVVPIYENQQYISKKNVWEIFNEEKRFDASIFNDVKKYKLLRISYKLINEDDRFKIYKMLLMKLFVINNKSAKKVTLHKIYKKFDYNIELVILELADLCMNRLGFNVALGQFYAHAKHDKRLFELLNGIECVGSDFVSREGLVVYLKWIDFKSERGL
jgi:hypothetical protein